MTNSFKIDHIAWAELTGCGSQDTATIPKLFRAAMLDAQLSLWSFERLTMIAENQGSVVEATLPLVLVFEHLAVEAGRESVRRSAQSLLQDLAMSVYTAPWGTISEQEERLRQRHVSDVVAASTQACGRLPDLGEASAEAVADYAWLEQARPTLLEELR